MTKSALSKQLRKLPVTDRIELIDELWHSLAADQSEIPVPDWQKQMIDESLAEIDANPGKGIPLEEFHERIDKLIVRMEKRSRKKK
jgi:putative addiction module component (TIGR02574 family)